MNIYLTCIVIFLLGLFIFAIGFYETGIVFILLSVAAAGETARKNYLEK